MGDAPILNMECMAGKETWQNTSTLKVDMKE